MKNTTRILFIVFALIAFFAMAGSAENNTPAIPETYFNGQHVEPGETIDIESDENQRSQYPAVEFVMTDGTDIYYRFAPACTPQENLPDFNIYDGGAIFIDTPGRLDYYAMTDSGDGYERSETAHLNFDIITDALSITADNESTRYFTLKGIPTETPKGFCIEIKEGKTRCVLIH